MNNLRGFLQSVFCVLFIITSLVWSRADGQTTGQTLLTNNPDLPLLPSSAEIDSEIETIIQRRKVSEFGTTPPSASELSAAITRVESVVVTRFNAAGEEVLIVPPGFDLVRYYNALGVLAKELHLGSATPDLRVRYEAGVRWLCDMIVVVRRLSPHWSGNQSVLIAGSVNLSHEFLSPGTRALWEEVLFKMFPLKYFWTPVYEEAFNRNTGYTGINVDWVKNYSSGLANFAAWIQDPKERYRFMLALKRWMDRFGSYTPGTGEGHKPDGGGFHHNATYEAYMNVYLRALPMLHDLRGTRFQISEEAYKVYRQGHLAKFVKSTNRDIMPSSMWGRFPSNRNMGLDGGRAFMALPMVNLAKIGGEILGLSTPDPLVSKAVLRRWGALDTEGVFSGFSPLTDEELGGFYQANHANCGIYRRNQWFASMKGLSKSLFGSEIYRNDNRYGRYQSYGALEIMYPGGLSENGYNESTWDWNHFPGTTSILLPWGKLHAYRQTMYITQKYGFAGALAFKDGTASELGDAMNGTRGVHGVFGMDFQEIENVSRDATYHENYENPTFRFKKSNFAFGDVIISLGSNINCDASGGPIVTTLYQRFDNNAGPVEVNGSAVGDAYTVAANDHWILNSYSTGFFVRPGSGTIHLSKASQQTPRHNLTWPQDLSTRPARVYFKGYLNHGDSPSDQSYEYVVVPDANRAKMQSLSQEITSGDLYKVVRQDEIAHIVKYHPDNTVGYCFFQATSDVGAGWVKGLNHSGLVMAQKDPNSNLMRMSINNPDVGILARGDLDPAPTTSYLVTLRGRWGLQTVSSDVSIASVSDLETVLQVNVIDGLAEDIVLSLISGPVGDINEFVNLARLPGAIASQPNTFRDLTADRAIDGNRSGNAIDESMSHSSGSSVARWELDLGADRFIENIVLYNRIDQVSSTDDLRRRLSNFKVTILDSQDEIVLERSFYTTTGYVGDLENWVTGGVTGQFVKIELLGRNRRGDYVLTLAEVEVLGRLEAPFLDGEVVAAVNLGGGAYTSPSGVSYAAGNSFAGSTYSSMADPVAGTDDDFLYQSEKYGTNLSYQFPVPNGSYLVTMKFSELYNGTNASGRIFSGSVEGQTAFTDLNLVALVGHDVAYDITVLAQVTDGSLNVSLSPTANNAKCAAILIESYSPTIALQNLAYDGNVPIPITTQSPSAAGAYGGAAARAIDGNTSGNWSSGSITHTDNNAGSFWKVDLQEPALIDQVILHNRNLDGLNVQRRLSNYRINILDSDGRTLRSEHFYPVSGYSGANEIWNTGGIVGQSIEVRLVGKNRDNNYFLSLAEVEAWGRKLPSFDVSQTSNTIESGEMYLKFDENSGTTATDSTANTNNGTLIDGPTWSAGKVGGALRFDGVDDFVTVADSPELRLGKNHTVSAWVNPDVSRSDWIRIVGKGGFSERNFGMWLQPNGQRILYQIQSASGDINCFSNQTIPLNDWTHVTCSYDGAKLRIYINGVLDKEQNYTHTPRTSADPLTIGYAGYHTPFDGRIDEVRVLNRTLSGSEIGGLAGLTAKSGSQANLATSSSAERGYENWAAANGMGAAELDDDNDGRSNFYDYANGQYEPQLSRQGSFLSFTHLERNDDPSLVYTLETSASLDGDWTRAAFPVQSVKRLKGEFDQVTYEVPIKKGKRFIRLKVSR